LEREAEDVAAVAEAIGEPVFILGTPMARHAVSRRRY